MGACFAIVGAVRLRVAKARLRQWCRVEGEVTSLVEDLSNNMLPMITFTPPGGPPVTFRGEVVVQPSHHVVGDKVPVRFNPSNPSEAMIDTAGGRWFLPVFLIAFGISWVVAGFFVMRTAR